MLLDAHHGVSGALDERWRAQGAWSLSSAELCLPCHHLES